jgi:hypothetical protein
MRDNRRQFTVRAGSRSRPESQNGTNDLSAVDQEREYASNRPHRRTRRRDVTPLVRVDAVVTFDPDTGTGSVDAGVIAASFGWTPEQLQQEAGALGFVLARKQVVTASCDGVLTTQITDRTDYILEFSEHRDDDGNLQGFTLNGLGRAVGQSSLPAVGSARGDAASVYPRVWTAVEEDSREDRVYVAYRGLQVLLWPGSAPGIMCEPVDEVVAISGR